MNGQESNSFSKTLELINMDNRLKRRKTVEDSKATSNIEKEI